ncbi:MAG: hypothetical protein ACYCXN_06095 [Acidimicrobiales bacterium]
MTATAVRVVPPSVTARLAALMAATSPARVGSPAKVTSRASSALRLAWSPDGKPPDRGGLQRNATKAERAVIDGVVLFGDPYFDPADSAVDRGTATAVPDGFHGLLGQRPKFGPNSKGKVLSYCELWDPICDADPNKEAWVAQLALFHKVHTTAYPPDGKKAAMALVHPTTIAAHAAVDGCYFSQAVASAIVGVSMGPPQPLPVTPPGSGDPICYYQELGGRVTLNSDSGHWFRPKADTVSGRNRTSRRAGGASGRLRLSKWPSRCARPLDRLGLGGSARGPVVLASRPGLAFAHRGALHGDAVGCLADAVEDRCRSLVVARVCAGSDGGCV